MWGFIFYWDLSAYRFYWRWWTCIHIDANFWIFDRLCGWNLSWGRYLEINGYSSKNIFISSIINLFFVYLFGMVYYYMISNFYIGTPFSVKNVILYCFCLLFPGIYFYVWYPLFQAKRF